MANNFGFFLKNLLVVSVAVNICLIQKNISQFNGGQLVSSSFFSSLWRNCEKKLNSCHGCSSFNGGQDDRMVQVSKKHLLLSSAALISKDVDNDNDGGDVINLDKGDPMMYEDFWKRTGEETTAVTTGWQFMSYFSELKGVCWFLEPAFASAVTRLHEVVGNAITDGHHIMVGTGSSQLYQAAIYALSPPNASEPMNVVSAVPFYSSYSLMANYMKSGLHKWGGDAYKFDKQKPYIEVVTSPNNPDGSIREGVVNGDKGSLIYDLAYYWPQYTPISTPANYDIMLFTASKCTGHAGTRIGWALVKDREIAKKMTKYIEINSIGVSKDSQIRAAKILQAVSDHGNYNKMFFDYSYDLMAKRWKELREALNHTELFTLPEFHVKTCSFSGRTFGQLPAFAWLKCNGKVDDCESFLRDHKIMTRGGERFGVSMKYARASMMSRERDFRLFTKRLSKINQVVK